MVADLAWSPAGDALAIQVVTDLEAGDEAMYLVELVPGLGRGPEAATQGGH